MRLIFYVFFTYISFVFFFSLLLKFHSTEYIDFEELEYGDVAVALNNGYLNLDNLEDFMKFPEKQREGSRLIFAPVISVVFYIFDSSLYSLKLAGILLAGLCAVIWLVISKLALPKLGYWQIALLFIIPLPLLQISGLIINSMMTHLGTCLWFGLSFLAIQAAFIKNSNKHLLVNIVAGFFAGIGVFFAYSLIPLLPGIAYLGWKRSGIKFFFQFLFGLLPGIFLFLYFLDIENLHGVHKYSGEGFFIFHLLKIIFFYGAGFITNPALPLVSQTTFYSPIGIIYSLTILVLIAAFLLYWKREKPPLESRQATILQSLLIAFVFYFLAIIITTFEMDISSFDTLRYLIPIAPIFVVFLLFMVSIFPQILRNSMITILIALHLLSTLLIIYPFEKQEQLKFVKGYTNLPVIKASLKPDFDKNVPQSMQIHNSFWIGVRKAQAHLGGRLISNPPEYYSAIAKEEYWRGVGYAIFERTHWLKNQSGINLIPELKRKYFFQGFAILLVCQNIESYLRLIPPKFHNDIFWGMGRGLKWDDACLDNIPKRIKITKAFKNGVREGWMLDFYIRPEEPVKHVDKIDGLKVLFTEWLVHPW